MFLKSEKEAKEEQVLKKTVSHPKTTVAMDTESSNNPADAAKVDATPTPPEKPSAAAAEEAESKGQDHLNEKT